MLVSLFAFPVSATEADDKNVEYLNDMALDIDGETTFGEIVLEEDRNTLSESSVYVPYTGDNTLYVKDGGTGDGSSANAAMGDLRDAIDALGAEGRIVICGNYTIADSDYHTNGYSYPVTITSNDGTTDYRSSAAIILDMDLHIGGETIFENIKFKTSNTNVFIYAKEKRLIIGNGVDTVLTGDNTNYINICGGREDLSSNGDAYIEINSGNWEALRGGSTRTGTATKRESLINITINGGTFHKYVIGGSRGNVYGDINIQINGGTFMQGVFAVYEEDGVAYQLYYDVVLDIRGGKFYAEISPARDKHTVLHGSYTVYLHGGSFDRITDFCGANEYDGDMTSALYIDPSFDIDSEQVGNISFKNYLYHNHADPFLFYYNGYYYYTFTAGTQLSLRKTANIADIKTASSKVILKPDGQNLWSPEIHYFSEAEAGAGNAGWYMFFSYDDGLEFSKQRMHVVKCLDGDNLMGRWGDPVTGEVNVPRKIEFPDAPTINVDAFCSGMSVLKVKGKTYITFVTDVGSGTSNFYQTIDITEMTNPWTMKGNPVVICQPEYSWEMEGYGYYNNTWYPKVVEGASPVYGDNGEVYLMYTGSGYWTTGYKLGFMKLTGSNPMSKSSWTKNPTPVLSKSDEINGCGHGSYFKDHDGNWWVCYHGYIGSDTSSGRYSFVERLYITSSGVSIGNKSGNPAPLSTTQTQTTNPIPTREKIHGFGSVGDIPVVDTSYKYISNAEQLIEYMNTPSAWANNYILTANIDLSQYHGTLTQQPIGNADVKFTGTFDGNGKIITGLNVAASGAVGMFGYITDNACIKNLTVYGSVTNTFEATDAESTLDGGIYATTGGLVGIFLGGTVENCKVYTNVSGAANVGGAIGMIYIQDYSTNTAVVNGVQSYSTINSTLGNIGGVIARITVTGDTALGVVIDSCVNHSNVISTSDDRCRVGGIVGYIHTETQQVVINKCINHGDVSGTNAKKETAHVPAVGGIVGRMEIQTSAKASVVVTECQNTGNITSNYRAAGVAAVISRSAICSLPSGIYRCENRGNVTVINNVMATNNLGGMAGYVDNSNSSVNYEISDCVNFGDIHCEGGKSYSGGIIGGPGSVDMIRCVNYGLCTTTSGYAGAIVGAEVNKGKYQITDCYALVGTADAISGYIRSTYCTHTNNTFIDETAASESAVYTALDFDNVWTIRDGKAAISTLAVNVTGDIDADGSLTNSDITLMIRYLNSWNIAGCESYADVNGDGVINNRDAIALIIKLS